ncbi:MAG TPA: DUF5989 family protein [Acidimicrobiales bacterium]|jgi:hypothetical protein|nr:DUF5989 family protein [Acidimicrobiales bacterium]
MGSSGVGDPGLRWTTRSGLRLKHSVRLGRDVARFGVQQRLWWFLPLIIVLMLLALAVTTTTTAVPVAVYTLF